VTPGTPTTAPHGGLRGEALATSLRAALSRYVRLLGAEPTLADDLVQEAFVVALQRPDFDASVPGAAFTFLRTTARRLWLHHHRGRGRERDVADADRVWDARCADDGGDGYIEALRTCVADLPERSRRLLEATYGDGAGRGATAAAFGMTGDGIKSALRRLRAHLHDCIERRARRKRP
jgi:DNA-directed RNA polymerase specialized sigma24 family protein